MKEFSIWYRYNGSTQEMKLLAESFEEAHERITVFKASRDEPRILCVEDATAELTPEQAG